MRSALPAAIWLVARHDPYRFGAPGKAATTACMVTGAEDMPVRRGSADQGAQGSMR